MNDFEVLNIISKFLKDNVASKIELKKPPEDNMVEGEYELVNLAVFTEWVPPKNYLDQYGHDIPALIVMIEDGEDNNESAELTVRVKIVTYDPGEAKENGTVTPNVDGYKDLLNVITRVRMELSQNPIILEKISIKKPIKWSMDKEQSYPYWSADLSFNVSIAPLAFNIEQYSKYL